MATASRRNLLKTMQVFLCIDIDGRVSLNYVERVASHLCVKVCPYTAALHRRTTTTA